MATKTEIQQILSKLNSIEQRISKIETAQAQQQQQRHRSILLVTWQQF